MREFFHGWRRKAGCVALVTACMLMGAWIRSLRTTDILVFAKGTATTDVFYSFDGSLVWRKVHQEWPNVKASFQEWDAQPRSDYDFFDDDRIQWLCRCCGTGIGEEVDGPKDWSLYVVVHYSAVAIPLTLVSAHLILWKPRKRAVT